MVFVHHQVCCIFQEGEYGRVEQDAEEGDKPETLVRNNQFDVGETERLFLLFFDTHHRSIQLLIHERIDEERDETDAEHDEAEEDGSRNTLEVLRVGHRDGHREHRTDTRRCHFQSHGEGEFLPLEPFYDNLRYGNTGDFHTDAEDGIAQRGQRNLRFDAEERAFLSDISRHGSIFDGTTDQHQETSPEAGEAHAHLIQNHSAEYQHQQEDVEPTVGAGE